MTTRPFPFLGPASSIPTTSGSRFGEEGFGEDFRKTFFADNPDLAFQTRLTQAGLPRHLTQFFRGRTSDFLKRFEGQLGSELERFGTTNLNPLDFFNSIDFNREFLRLSPQERGTNTSQFNPVTRFIGR